MLSIIMKENFFFYLYFSDCMVKLYIQYLTINSPLKQCIFFPTKNFSTNALTCEETAKNLNPQGPK